ncbi:MAG TPA: prenyltransferase [Acidimicrobiia bacterium]|nr:prenyltransferase [Acidimicrobiia bacterium]
MTRLTPADAVARAARYDHVVLTHVDADGYPLAVAADFETGGDGEVITSPLPDAARPPAGRTVGLVWSHIRPQPGVGYDERRYVNAWGDAQLEVSRVRVAVSQAVGWDEQETPFFEYAERSVPAAHDYFDAVGARPRLSRFWTVFRAARLPFLTATVVPIALGGAVAGAHGRFSWLWFGLAMVAGIAVHLGLNIANDVFDDASGADAANVTPTPFSGGSRMIQYGLVSRRTMARAAIACYAVATILGVVIAAERGWWLLAIGAVGLVVSAAYTAPPLRLAHHGLGELAVMLGFGPVMVVGTYYACAQRWSWEALFVSVPVACLIGLVLYENEIPDRTSDAHANKRTLPVRWSPAAVVRVYAVTATLTFVAVVAGVAVGMFPIAALLALATIPMAVRVYRGLAAHYDSPYELMQAMQTGIALHLLTGLALVIAYLL